MGSVCSLESYTPVRQLLFPRPQPLRQWTSTSFLSLPGLAPFIVYYPTLALRTPVSSLIIHSHGNGSDAEAMSYTLQEWADSWNCMILSWEYAGYGPRHKEYPSAQSMRDDIVALYDYMRAKYPNLSIYTYGHSLGSGPALWLASQRPDLAGCIVQSPYTRICDVLKEGPGMWPKLSYVCPVVFDNMKAVALVQSPLLFIHGEDDPFIPVAHSVRLAELATRAKSRKVVRCKRATHNDWNTEEDIIKPVQVFMTNLFQLTNE